MLYTGGQMKGEAALTAGLCDRLAPAAELRPAALALAAEIAAAGPLAVRSIRQTMRGGLAEEIRRATERESQAQIALRGTEDFAEGVRAMAERRTPEFSGR
jgi:enoyl-CoA hydratase/carnithine racemase